MSIVSTLNEKLLKQPFTEDHNRLDLLADSREIASNYAKTENSIAVVSDLKSNRSYIYYGGVAESLGIATKNSQKEIYSIWEKEIFNKIHPDDLIEKHVLELHFFHLLKTLPVKKRSDYYITSKMRMCDKSGKYTVIHHRMFYVCSSSSGDIWLSLCLYNHWHEQSIAETLGGTIINSATGNAIKTNKKDCSNILSYREKEILQLIEKGRTSKDIAGVLSISKNTVDRHRQNILEKLRVTNSIEACRVAKLMDLL